MGGDSPGSLKPGQLVRPKPAAPAVWMNVRRFIGIPLYARSAPALSGQPIEHTEVLSLPVTLYAPGAVRDSSFSVHREREQQIARLPGGATITRVDIHHAGRDGRAAVVQRAADASYNSERYEPFPPEQSRRRPTDGSRWMTMSENR